MVRKSDGDTPRIYRYQVPADGQPHEVSMFAASAVLATAVVPPTDALDDHYVEFWAEHYDGSEYDKPRFFKVVGTGDALPTGYRWAGTARSDQGRAYHLYEKS